MNKKLLIFFLLIFSFFVFLNLRKIPQNSIQKKSKEFSLEQKVGQLFLIGFEGTKVTGSLENLLKTVRPGGIILLSKNIQSKEQLKKLIFELQKISLKETGLPLFVAIDQEGGKVCRIKFLDCKSQSKIKNEKEAFSLGFKRAKELKELGINLNLAPLLDLARPQDFIYQRTFQKDPLLTGKIAKSLILGQKEGKILTAIKHFPGYGSINFNPEKNLPFLENLPPILPFEIAKEAKPEMIMTANVVFSKIEKVPFSLSKKGIKFLREKFGQEILILSDDLSTPALKERFSLKEIVLGAKKAGIDILLWSDFWSKEKEIEKAYQILLKGVKSGQISKKNIDFSFLKILKLKSKIDF